VILVTCSKDEDDYTCEEGETWSIKGRFINGTTGEGYANRPWRVVLLEGDFGGQVDDPDVYEVGEIVTDEEGYFSVEYSCKAGDWGRVGIYDLPNDLFYAKEFPFKKQFEQDVYWSDSGTLYIEMTSKEPLGEDTLFYALKGSSRTYFEDTITSEGVDTAIYFRGSPGGVCILLVS